MRHILMILTNQNSSLSPVKWDIVVAMVTDEVKRLAYRTDMIAKGQPGPGWDRHCWLFTVEDVATEIKLHDSIGPLLRQQQVAGALTWAVVGDFGEVS